MAIKINKSIVDDVIINGLDFNFAIAKDQSNINEYNERKEKNKNLTAIDMAMNDAGIHKNTILKDYYNTNRDSWLFPAFVDNTVRTVIGRASILPYLVGNEQTITGRRYEGTYLDASDSAEGKANKKALNLMGVEDGTELPFATIKTGKSAINIYKFGLAIKSTYEAMQWSTFDQIRTHLNLIGQKAGGQEANRAIDVLINGDGNNNAATVVKTTETSFSKDELVNFLLDFSDNADYSADTILCDRKAYQSLLNIAFANNLVNGLVPGATFTFPQDILGGATIVYHKALDDGTGKGRLIAYNKANGLKKLISAGTQIQETQAFITNQTNVWTNSEYAGFMKIDKNSAMILQEK